jgi:heterodisulfide reductase subunit C
MTPCAHEALQVELTGDTNASRLVALRCRHCGACVGRSAPGMGRETDFNWRAPFKLRAGSHGL